MAAALSGHDYDTADQPFRGIDGQCQTNVHSSVRFCAGYRKAARYRRQVRYGEWGVSETCRLLGLAVIYVPGIYELIGILRSRSIAAALFGRCTDKMPSRAVAQILS